MKSALTAALTVPRQAERPQDPSPAEVVARARALGWSQNELGRRAKKDSGFVSRLLTGKVSAPGAYADLVRVIERAERRRSRARVA